MKLFFRMLALGAAAALLLSALAACAGGTPDDTAAPAATTAAAESETSVESTVPGLSLLEVKDLGGKEILMLWPDYLISEGHFMYNELGSAGEDSSTVIDSTIYSRNRAVEEAYKVKITVGTQKYSSIPGTVRNEYKTNESTYAAVATVIAQLSPIALEGVLADFRELKYYDESQEWWNHKLMSQYAIAGHRFFGSGDIIYSDDLYPYVVYANTGLAGTLGINDDFYDLVSKREWTLDKFHELAVIAVADLDGDGEAASSVSDRFGAADGTSFARAIYYSAGKGVMSADDSGKLNVDMTLEHAESVLAKVKEVFHKDRAVVDVGSKYGVKTAVGMMELFNSDRILFMPGDLKAAQTFSTLDSALSDFALLPMPLWNGDSDYICVLNDAVLISVPAMYADLDDASLVLSAMSRASVDTLTPAFFELILTYRYLTSSKSVDTLHLILDSTVPRDVADIQGWGDLMGIFSRCAVENRDDFASSFTSGMKMLNSKLRSYEKQLQGLG